MLSRVEFAEAYAKQPLKAIELGFITRIVVLEITFRLERTWHALEDVPFELGYSHYIGTLCI